MKKTILLLSILFIARAAQAQCNAPTFTVNLSAAADTSWTLSGQGRSGNCCGSSNCVTFVVTLHPGSELISFDVTNPSPSGSAFYQVNCGTPVSIGTPLCVVGLLSPLTITYCKPGNDKPDYVITAATVVKACADITLQKTACKDTLTVSNVIPSTVVWTSIYPGSIGDYNAFLSCTTGCTSTIVTPGTGAPPYVDYEVSGTPTFTCGASTDRDTVRVYFVPALSASISPPSPVICTSSGASVTLTANPYGGSAPYTYTWSTGANTQTVSVSSAGTYTLVVGDATKCPAITLTKTVSTLPSATFSYGSPGYCQNSVNPLPVFSGNSQAGGFTSSPAGVSFVSSSTGEINLGASVPGTYTVTNTIAASNGCPTVSDSAIVTIYEVPLMTSIPGDTICMGTTLTISLSSSVPSSFSWLAADNPNTSGESTSSQTGATITDSIINTASAAQVVLYTVVPVSLAGGCTGPAQTLSVTVLPLDDPGFSYASSTFCQTASDPSATVTGLAGGIFSGSAGLVFSNVSNGTIQLSASSVGTYTVTYSTNGACPSSLSVPLTITTAPSAVFTYNASPYCQTQSNPLPAFAPGASGGTFSSTAGLVFVSTATGEVDLSASTPGTYTITNYIPPQGDCAAATATATITITALPDAAFSYPGSPYCENGSDPVPVLANGAIAGVFFSQSGLSLDTASGAVGLSASTPGTYTVSNTIAAAGGCPQVSASATIAITALPVASFTYTSTPYCADGSDPAPTFVGGGTGGVFTASSVFVSLSAGTGMISLANSSAGSYIITNTIPAAGGCPAVSASASVDISDPPVASFAYTGSPYCQDMGIVYPTFASNAVSGVFSASASGLALDTNSGTLDLQASLPGTYTIANYVPAYAGCGAVTAHAVVTVHAMDDPTFGYSSPTFCAGDEDPVPTITGLSGGSFSCAGISVDTATGTIDLSTCTPGSYTVSYTTAGACPMTSTLSVSIDQPAFASAGSDQVVCYGDSVMLLGAVSGSAGSASWSGGGAFAPASDSLFVLYIPSAAEAQAGSATLVLTTDDPSGACPAVSDTVSIAINPLPDVPTPVAPGFTYCASEVISPVTLNASGTVLWADNQAMSPVIYYGSSYAPGVLPIGTTVLYFIDSLATGCKSAAVGSVSITVNGNPPVPVITVSSYTYCHSMSVLPISTTAGSNAIWSTNAGMSPVIHVGSSYTPAGLQPGNVTFYVADSTLEGCKSQGTASVTVLIYPDPVVNGSVAIDSANCGLQNGGVSGIEVSGGTPGYTYQWYNGAEVVADATSSTLSGVGPGTYSVLVTDSNGCVAGGNATTFVVPASSNLASEFTASNVFGTAPMSCVFVPVSGGAVSYSWTLGNGSTCATSTAQTVYTAPGTYTVSLTTTLGTCVSVTTKTLQVDAVPTVEIPNVFTPNGDGVNDFLTIHSEGITELHSEIYNRWGALVQTLDGVQAGWDGRSQHNETVVDGTYFVILKARTKDGIEIERQGYVTLVR